MTNIEKDKYRNIGCTTVLAENQENLGVYPEWYVYGLPK